MTVYSRRFAFDDQRAFAALSGDWNPIHLDPLYARRTIAGQAVVHGVHLLLWALNTVATALPMGLPSRIVAEFSRFVLVGEDVELSILSSSAERLRLVIAAAGIVRTEVIVSFLPGDRIADPLEICGSTFDPGQIATAALPQPGIGAEGYISAAARPEILAAAFPATADWIGVHRIGALAAMTRLVGMVFPGEHSIFSSLSIRLTAISDGESSVSFKMSGPRHGLIAGRVAGGGIEGRLSCLMRQPPLAQPGMEECARLVQPNAFAGSDALVIGGSRGLGELTAKLIAAGGGSVTLTYARGEGEAHRVAAEIGDSGGRCVALPYRVGEEAGAQLAILPVMPSHIYYFATPTIARPPGSRFLDTGHLAHLQRIFVDGFWDIVSAVVARRTGAAFFYPSTVYIDDRPEGFAEYAMAKAAGEILCSEINGTMSPTHVFCRRLPRLATDQTVGILGIDAEDSASTLLPSIRQVQAY